MKILVSDGLDEAALQKLRSSYDVDSLELSQEELLNNIGNYDALIVRSRTKVTKEIIEKGRNLKVIARAGVGVDNIDVEAAKKKGIVVVNAPTGSTVSVAELTMGLIISIARQIPQADKSVKEGKWEKKRFEGTELAGKILGLIGLGRIGTQVAERARAFGMETVGFDPYLTEEKAKEKGVKLLSLEELLRVSDFVSIHCALTPETMGMIGEKELAKMKKTAYLINSARGGIVDEEALYEALKAGRIAGAALDVFEKEPPSGSPLLSLDNVVFTPHLGASTKEAQPRTGMIIVDQVNKVLSGKKAEFMVN